MSRGGGKKITVCGYYGRGNLGDEMLLEAISRALRSGESAHCAGAPLKASQFKNFAAPRGANAPQSSLPEPPKIRVLRGKNAPQSHLPKPPKIRTPRGANAPQSSLPEQPKIRVLRGKNPFRLLSDMLCADVFLFGGGSLLQNATSSASLFYYLALIFASRALCRHRVMLANGIGPIKNGFFSQNFLKKAIKTAVNSFEIISVRDKRSQKFLQDLLPKREILLVPDPALLLIEPKINQQLRKTGRFSYIPCASGLKRAKIDEDSLSKALREAERELGLKAFFVVMNENEDGALARRLSNALGGRELRAPKSASELEKALSDTEISVCQRFHGALFSSALGVPTLCISIDPKMTALCEDFGLFPAISPAFLADFSALPQKMEGAKRHFSRNGTSIYAKFQAAKDAAESSLKSIIG